MESIEVVPASYRPPPKAFHGEEFMVMMHEDVIVDGIKPQSIVDHPGSEGLQPSFADHLWPKNKCKLYPWGGATPPYEGTILRMETVQPPVYEVELRPIQRKLRFDEMHCILLAEGVQVPEALMAYSNITRIKDLGALGFDVSFKYSDPRKGTNLVRTMEDQREIATLRMRAAEESRTDALKECFKQIKNGFNVKARRRPSLSCEISWPPAQQPRQQPELNFSRPGTPYGQLGAYPPQKQGGASRLPPISAEPQKKSKQKANVSRRQSITEGVMPNVQKRNEYLKGPKAAKRRNSLMELPAPDYSGLQNATVHGQSAHGQKRQG